MTNASQFLGACGSLQDEFRCRVTRNSIIYTKVSLLFGSFLLLAPLSFKLLEKVKVLPTVICFIDGIAVHHIIGFEGLTKGLADDKLDEWPVSNLARELALAKVR